MPHCLIEGSQSLTQLITPAELLRLVEEASAATGLFQPGEVKLRLSLYEHFSVGGTREDLEVVKISSAVARLSPGVRGKARYVKSRGV